MEGQWLLKLIDAAADPVSVYLRLFCLVKLDSKTQLLLIFLRRFLILDLSWKSVIDQEKQSVALPYTGDILQNQHCFHYREIAAAIFSVWMLWEFKNGFKSAVSRDHS